MTITPDEERAIVWAIAMIRPNDDKHSESLPSRVADTLQGLLNKHRGETNEPS